ncbi:hypothetical protein P7C70_g2420, partial [Phenoliferia sp. Uapishka_3]
MLDTSPYSPPLPLQDATTSSPISTIPTEVLARILRSTFSAYGTKECRQTMTRCALVSATWCPIAQECLWRRINVTSTQKSISLARTPRTTMYPTHTLLFSPHEAAGLIERVLSNLCGVEELVMRGERQELVPFFLEAAALRNLTILHLDSMSGIRNVDFLTSLPKQLHTLSVGPSFTCPALLTALISASSQSLKRLSLHECINIRPHNESDSTLPSLPLLEAATFNNATSDFACPFTTSSTKLKFVHISTDRGKGEDVSIVVDWLDDLDFADDDSPAVGTDELIITSKKLQPIGVREAIIRNLASESWIDFRALTFSATEKEMSRTPGAVALFRRLKNRSPPIEITYSYQRKSSQSEDPHFSDWVDSDPESEQSDFEREWMANDGWVAFSDDEDSGDSD